MTVDADETPLAATGISSTIAAFTAGLSPDDVPRAARESAAVSLLDGVGVALAASRLGEGCETFARLVLDDGGRADATVMGFGGRVPASGAALANGSMSHALDYEDSVDGVAVHPHAQVIPAVLALAEQRDLDGPRLIAAIALGCDITVRLGRATGDSLADLGWYPPPILGGFGATVACAFLVGLNERQVLDAVSLALSQLTASGEIKHSPESVIRGVRDGFAAQSAVRAVQLAERGIRGFDRPFEGASAFFASFAGGDARADALIEGLGERWAGTETSYKPWPSCRGTHSFVQAALDLRRQVSAEQWAGIREVTLVGAPVNEMLARPLAAKQHPSTAIDAKFSLPFTVATAMVTGAVTLDSFSAKSLNNREVLDLATRVRFVADESGRYGMTSGRMTVHTDSGEQFERTVEQPRGNPDDPIPRSELRAKFVACAAEAAVPFEHEQATLVADQILSVESLPALREPLGRWLAAR